MKQPNVCNIKVVIFFHRVFSLKLHESKAQDEVFVMNRRFVVEDVFLGHPLPPRPARRLDHRGQAVGKQGPAVSVINFFCSPSLTLGLNGAATLGVTAIRITTISISTFCILIINKMSLLTVIISITTLNTMAFSIMILNTYNTMAYLCHCSVEHLLKLS